MHLLCIYAAILSMKKLYLYYIPVPMGPLNHIASTWGQLVPWYPTEIEAFNHNRLFTGSNNYALVVEFFLP